jgi:hypothetical protein
MFLKRIYTLTITEGGTFEDDLTVKDTLFTEKTLLKDLT